MSRIVLNIVVLFGVTHGFRLPSFCRKEFYVESHPKSDKEIAVESVSSILRTFGFGLAAVSGYLVNAPASKATTYFDTDVYGDKELKIATVNKIKQKIRNAILKDPKVAPELLKLSISDALGYNAQTGQGGQDGSIIFEFPKDEVNDGLQNAVNTLKIIQKELQRTNTVAFGDLVAFGGAVALETVGAPRVTVQVGRYEVKQPNPEYTLFRWTDSELSPSNVRTIFGKAGLDPQTIVLLLGGIGEVSRVVNEYLNKSTGDEEEDDEFEAQPFVPTTFGARDEIYGQKLGKADFGSKYFASILSSKESPDPLASILLEDPVLKALVKKYAASEPAFVKDSIDAYYRMTLVGQQYTTRNS